MDARRGSPSALSASLVGERESLIEFTVRVHLVTLRDDRDAVQHVAIAVRRPAVANIVGAGEHRHAAGAERLHRRDGRGGRARRHDRDFGARQVIGGLFEKARRNGPERERVANRDAPVHAGGDRSFGDVVNLGCPGLAAVVQVNVDSLAEPFSEPENDVELTFDVSVETGRVQAADQVGACRER